MVSVGHLVAVVVLVLVGQWLVVPERMQPTVMRQHSAITVATHQQQAATTPAAEAAVQAALVVTVHLMVQARSVAQAGLAIPLTSQVLQRCMPVVEQVAFIKAVRVALVVLVAEVTAAQMRCHQRLAQMA